MFYETTLDLSGVSSLDLEYIYELSGNPDIGLSVFVGGTEEFNTTSYDSIGSGNWRSQSIDGSGYSGEVSVRVEV